MQCERGCTSQQAPVRPWQALQSSDQETKGALGNRHVAMYSLQAKKLQMQQSTHCRSSTALHMCNITIEVKSKIDTVMHRMICPTWRLVVMVQEEERASLEGGPCSPAERPPLPPVVSPWSSTPLVLGDCASWRKEDNLPPEPSRSLSGHARMLPSCAEAPAWRPSLPALPRSLIPLLAKPPSRRKLPAVRAAACQPLVPIHCRQTLICTHGQSSLTTDWCPPGLEKAARQGLSGQFNALQRDAPTRTVGLVSLQADLNTQRAHLGEQDPRSNNGCEF